MPQSESPGSVTESQIYISDEERQRQIEANQPVIKLLQSWFEVDEEAAAEQRRTLALLKIALDEDRAPGEKLFS
ncbi:MAG TPA: hypothetical protein VFL82_04390 [Thermomicrobiales bacterium]|nr:hypothetical protein [Thermomicrobiales bacterium]